MRNGTVMKIGGALVLCVAGVLGWTNRAHATSAYEIGKSIPAAELGQLQASYGIHFVASPGNANKEPIRADQAVAAENKMFTKPIPLEAVFGYMSISPTGNAVFIPPTTEAGRTGHGIVSHYPVWVVIQDNAPLFLGGPARTRSQQQSKGREKLLNAKGSYLTFVDATNGQRFFTVTVSN